jgi:hypothetical protein
MLREQFVGCDLCFERVFELWPRAMSFWSADFANASVRALSKSTLARAALQQFLLAISQRCNAHCTGYNGGLQAFWFSRGG